MIHSMSSDLQYLPCTTVAVYQSSEFISFLKGTFSEKTKRKLTSTEVSEHEEFYDDEHFIQVKKRVVRMKPLQIKLTLGAP